MGGTESYGAIRIRIARRSDASVLAGLCTQLGYPSTPGEVAERLESIFGHPDHVVLVAELDSGAVAGFLHGFCGVVLETGERAEIVGLVADSGHRGQGVGKSLVAEAERWARSKGHRTLHVRCNVVRTAAHAFYEGLGFALVKTQKNFQKKI